jgi:hypothetical protein
LLAGCGDTTIAFCSGGDDFCDDFIVKLGGEDEDEQEGEEGEEADPADNAQVTAVEPLQAALKIARLTPRLIDTALTDGSMENLVVERPDLVGLWLVQGSLARLWEPNDNVATTRFLDQNRAWLLAEQGDNTRASSSELQVLGSGLGLFAAFAADLDPGSAEAALARANHGGIGYGGIGRERPATASRLFAERAAQTVVGAAQAPHGCCVPADLAAAALVLCDAHDEARSQLNASRVRACGWAGSWFDD